VFCYGLGGGEQAEDVDVEDLLCQKKPGSTRNLVYPLEVVDWVF
jgi:hypothetical protein